MSDVRLRELERRWKESGAREDEAEYLLERVRVGDLGRSALRLMAYYEHPAALLAFDGDPAPTLHEPEGRLGELLERYKEVGGVVEHLLFETDPGEGGAAWNVLVVQEALRVLQRRWEARNRRLSRLQKIPLDQFWRMSIHAERARRIEGTRIRGVDFLGFSDLDLLATLFPGYEPGEDEDEELQGYSHAASNPPYGMRASPTDVSRLVLELCDALFDGLGPEVEIFSWPTDWSNFFDAGREWWGTFLWTVQPPGAPYTVAVAASTTD